MMKRSEETILPDPKDKLNIIFIIKEGGSTTNNSWASVWSCMSIEINGQTLTLYRDSDIGHAGDGALFMFTPDYLTLFDHGALPHERAFLIIAALVLSDTGLFSVACILLQCS